MTKATIKITGDKLKDTLTKAISEFQEDDHAIHYETGTASIFMFSQYRKSLSNFALNVILDDAKMSPDGNEFIIQCFAMGQKDRMTLTIMNFEKSIVNDLRAHLFGYKKRNNCDWNIGELNFLK